MLSGGADFLTILKSREVQEGAGFLMRVVGGAGPMSPISLEIIRLGFLGGTWAFFDAPVPLNQPSSAMNPVTFLSPCRQGRAHFALQTLHHDSCHLKKVKRQGMKPPKHLLERAHAPPREVLRYEGEEPGHLMHEWENFIWIMQALWTDFSGARK